MADSLRDLSQLAEFAKDDRSDVRSWSAPAAAYFVTSVFPISMTSGAFPPASVASNFCRWVVHVWYCTLTSTPGWSFPNCELTAATSSGQPFCASVCSQTVMLACDRAVLDEAVTPTAASTATARRMRAFMNEPP